MALVTAFTLALPAGAAMAGTAAAAPVDTAPALAAPVVAAPAAEQADTCGGTRVRHVAIKAGGRTVAWANLYHNRSTATKCAQVVHAGPAWGRQTTTAVTIWNGELSAHTGGTSRYRSGKAYIRGVNGDCVAARGAIVWGGSTRIVSLAGHCG
jgi:hypothetical protein